jgi:hypothetical protein
MKKGVRQDNLLVFAAHLGRDKEASVIITLENLRMTIVFLLLQAKLRDGIEEVISNTILN